MAKIEKTEETIKKTYNLELNQAEYDTILSALSASNIEKIDNYAIAHGYELLEDSTPYDLFRKIKNCR